MSISRAYLTRRSSWSTDRDCDRPAEHDRRHLVDASVSANTRRAYARVSCPTATGGSTGAP